MTVADVASDPKWTEFSHYILPLGLVACWSSPIRDASGRVLGTFAIYYRQRRGPTSAEARLVVTCTYLCAIAMERHDRVLEHERKADIDELTGLLNRASAPPRSSCSILMGRSRRRLDFYIAAERRCGWGCDEPLRGTRPLIDATLGEVSSPF